MNRQSTYDLRAALNYLRLAYQSMSVDQAAAQKTVMALAMELPTVEERLRALAEIVVFKTKELRS
jgi:hypothetical protein